MQPALNCDMDVRMVPGSNSKSRKSRIKQEVQPSGPVWNLPDEVLGSAVRYIASFSPDIHWVGAYVLKGRSLDLGPFIGIHQERTRFATLTVPIYSKKGKLQGEMNVQSHDEVEFTPEIISKIHQTIKELEEVWQG